MKKLAGGSPIMVESVAFNGKKADPITARSTSLGSTGTQPSVPPGEWSVTDAVELAKAFWGNEASTVIAWSALAAHCEGNMPEYGFWFEVFAHLHAGSSDSDWKA
ncbi:hypothetical protein ACWGS9_24045 [Bradyrhizobium sp. Arg314]